MKSDSEVSLFRRRALTLGGGIAAGLTGIAFPLEASAADETAAATKSIPASKKSSLHTAEKLPMKQIEEILRTEGKMSDGVLALSQDRTDLQVTGPGGIPFKAAWQVNHEFAFQSLGNGKAIMIGELSLLSKETNPVIDQLIKHDLTFQALHQHFFDLSPQLFHIHFRGVGNPLDLARAVAAVVGATATPLPQKSPITPKTVLDKERLERILGGTAEVADDGVVVVTVLRKETVVLGGIRLNSEMGVSHTVAFEPLDGGRGTAVAPDFALVASEINPLVKLMREQGFTIHCLYNQETAESPQLYYSHQLAVGDAYDLARKVRKGLERTNSKFKS